MMQTCFQYPLRHTGKSLFSLRADWLIALAPLLLWGVFVFGLRTLTVAVLSVGSCYILEFLFRLILKKPLSGDLFSPAVTGLLLSLTLPYTVPFWTVPVGALIAVSLSKSALFLGRCPLHPALCGGVVVQLAFPNAGVPSEFEKLGLFQSPDSSFFSGNAPLYSLLSYDPSSRPDYDSVLNSFLGLETGVIGEVSVLLLLLCALWLFFRKAIDWRIPVGFVFTVAVVTYLFPAEGFARMELPYALAHLCTGGVAFGALLLAPDPTASPLTPGLRWCYGIGCGAMTVLLRYILRSEGVYLSILAMDLLFFFLERSRLMVPSPFGGKRARNNN
ncbi:MAG TPA: hypothetical protein DEV98_04620 [Clostridiales bacterium]|nr:hypothetical protein [Clostridiales bacterium]